MMMMIMIYCAPPHRIR